ncbi:AAA family ATPase [Endozoicomonas euniceicola]|uniref:Uncharacterized AAA domain-containing protein ycf46 n=1 Tax=Endozoicomonas euniceicola TaxID=1234143 RepID=A0ABY6GT14_9GAMM|nr:AAA family ATPase [Endozoicomonas euniceicola]UYM15903.1 AAA family ATPase [Endozoicomonas euniceicola]
MSELFSDSVTTNIRAGAPIIQIIGHDTLRIHAVCLEAAQETNRTLYIWNRCRGIREFQGTSEQLIKENINQLPELLDWYLSESFEPDDFSDAPDAEQSNSILLIEDIHAELEQADPSLISQLRSYALQKSRLELTDQAIILSQPVSCLPVELQKDTQVLSMPLPDREEIKTLIEATKEHYGIDDRDFDESARLIDAALGLSTSEAQLAFAKVAVAKGRLTEAEVDLVVSEKEQVIRKSGLLEYFHPQFALEDVGGLQNLKSWLNRRSEAFSENARKCGLEYPKGVLMLGLPGTGKSLTAKAVSSSWQLPLLRLDMGKVFGGIVGQSEENIRNALQVAETISPCILWVDEIEKALSGMQSSGSTDGGTTSRVLGTFLTWMQEKTSPVFVLATANHIEMLPPELLRKGRVDEIFFVDLPTCEERKDILSIHLRRRDRGDALSDDNLNRLASISKGFTGAELEEAVKEAMFMAFSDDRPLQWTDIERAIQSTSPLSVTMQETILDTREWIKGRAVPASAVKPDPLPEAKDKSDVRPRLIQEGKNPFVKNNK